MPYIKCPTCNKKSLARLPGEFTLTSWAKTYGTKPAPLTCTEANVYNSCSQAIEEKALSDKKAREADARAANREIALNLSEVALVINSLTQATDLHKALLGKLKNFLEGDNSFVVIGQA